MATKAYQHLFRFNCGYDHPRTVLYTPATSTSSVNLYGTFKKDAILSDVPTAVGCYVVWRSGDTNKQLDIENCILYEKDEEPNLINKKEYIDSFDSSEKKLLAQKMLQECNLYWARDDWYTQTKAYMMMDSEERTAINSLEMAVENMFNADEDDGEDPCLKCTEEDCSDCEYNPEYEEGYEDTPESEMDSAINKFFDSSPNMIDLTEISEDELSKVVAILKALKDSE